MIMTKHAKKWLAIAAVVLLTPIFSAAHPADGKKKTCGDDLSSDKKCKSVADGGSAAGYLIAVGATCLGAIIVRSRSSKPRLS